MKTVPCATVITLTGEERAVLEALRRSTKSEARMRFRAGIVILERTRWAREGSAAPLAARPALFRSGECVMRATVWLGWVTPASVALNVASGKLVGRHYQRRRRVEFLDFRNTVVSDHPDRDIHVILDPQRQVAQWRILQDRRSAQGPHRRFYRRRQRTSQTVRLD